MKLFFSFVFALLAFTTCTKPDKEVYIFTSHRALSMQLEGGKNDTMDKLRKQVMAAIGGYLRKINRDGNAEIINRNLAISHSRNLAILPVLGIKRYKKSIFFSIFAISS